MRLRLAQARTGLAMWTDRQRWAAAIGASGTFLALALPTALIPNPVFGREIPPTWWSYPVAVVTALLAGMVLATYVRPVVAWNTRSRSQASIDPHPNTDRATRAFTAGGLLAFFAVGCPVCNKIVLIALGTSGAVQWFAPIQPVLALAGIAVLAWAVITRLAGSVSCAIPDPNSDRRGDQAEAQSGAAAN